MQARKPDTDIVVILVVDSELVAMGLALALGTRHRIHLAAVARNVADAQRAIAKFDPDLVLVESGMARALGAELAPTAWRTRILVLGRNEHIGVEPPFDTDHVCGFLSYGAGSAHYLATIDVVSACGQEQARAGSVRCGRCTVRGTLALAPLGLTGRELEVFTLTGRGFRSAEIARALGVSTKTVDAHRESIKYKLGLDSARALNVAAARWCRGEDLDAGATPAPPVDTPDGQKPRGRKKVLHLGNLPIPMRRRAD
jgi:DNA-binding NarL/FixJ family response regulator